MAENAIAPVYTCECGASVPLENHKVGDVLDCRSCQKPRVLIRSRITGSLPENYGSMRFLTTEERLEVKSAFDNIVKRRGRRKTGQLTLVKSRWIFLLGLLGPYLSGFLAQQNLTALGKPVRGKRLLIVSLLSYLLVFGFLVATYNSISPWLSCALLFAYVFFMALYVTLSQVKDTLLGFENFSKAQFPLVPALIGVAVALGEGFLARTLIGQITP
jgi:hypothetical protein